MSISVCKEELKIREYDRYLAFGRGIHLALRQRYGSRAESLFAESMTGLSILQFSVSGETPMVIRKTVPGQPFKRTDVYYGTASEYAADMLLLLHEALFGVPEGRERRRGSDRVSVLRKMTERQYPYQAEEIRRYAEELLEAEEADEPGIDCAAGCFGHMLAAVFRRRDDESAEALSNLGFYLGKFYYLLTSYLSAADDLQARRYNVWRHYCMRRDYEALAENAMLCMAAEAAEAFEKLPIRANEEILRNILYDGIWEPLRAYRAEEGNTKRVSRLPIKIPVLRKDPWARAKAQLTAFRTDGSEEELSPEEAYETSLREGAAGNNILAYRYAAAAYDAEPDRPEYRERLNELQAKSGRYRMHQARKM